MKLLAFTIKPCGPVSFRLYHTFQAAASYPLPPPSAIYGLLANALVLKDRLAPKDAVAFVANKVRFVWLKAVVPNGTGDRPKLITSFWAPVKTLFYDQRIKGNILSREFIFAPHGFRAYALTDGDTDRLADAVRSAPLYIGDSEGLVSIHDIELADAKECDGAGSVAVYFPAGWARIRVLGDPDKEGVSLFPVNRWQKPHEWSMGGDATKKRKGKKRGNLLEQYCFPIVRRGRFVVPTRPAVEEWLVEVAFFKAPDGEILPFASNGK